MTFQESLTEYAKDLLIRLQLITPQETPETGVILQFPAREDPAA